MFSIILPTIARPSLITAVNSVIAQTFQDWELIVVLDRGKMSFEQAANIEDELLALDKRIIVGFVLPRSSDENYCGTMARNHGIFRLSTKPWVAYLDDDSLYYPDHLSVFANMAQEYPSASMLHTRGAAFKMKHRHPRTSEKVKKIVGYSHISDMTCVGMAHTRDIFNGTEGWTSQHENHDARLWEAMLRFYGTPILSDEITYEFEI